MEEEDGTQSPCSGKEHASGSTDTVPEKIMNGTSRGPSPTVSLTAMKVTSGTHGSSVPTSAKAQKPGASNPIQLVQLSLEDNAPDRTQLPKPTPHQPNKSIARPASSSSLNVLSSHAPEATALGPFPPSIDGGINKAGHVEDKKGTSTASVMTSESHGTHGVTSEQYTQGPTAGDKDGNSTLSQKGSSLGSVKDEEDKVFNGRDCAFCKAPFKAQYCQNSSYPIPSACIVCRGVKALLRDCQRHAEIRHNEHIWQRERLNQTINSLYYGHRNEIANLTGLQRKTAADLVCAENKISALSAKAAADLACAEKKVSTLEAKLAADLSSSKKSSVLQAELTAELASAEEKISALEGRMASELALAEKKSSELQANAVAELALAKNTISVLRYELDSKMCDNDVDDGKWLQAQQHREEIWSLEKDFTLLQKQAGDRIAEMQNEKQQEIEDLHRKHEKAIADIRAQHEDQLHQLQAENSAKLKKATDQRNSRSEILEVISTVPETQGPPASQSQPENIQAQYKQMQQALEHERNEMIKEQAEVERLRTLFANAKESK